MLCGKMSATGTSGGTLLDKGPVAAVWRTPRPWATAAGPLPGVHPMSTDLPLTRYWQTVQDFRSEIKQLSHDPDLGTACLQHLTDLEILLHPHAAAVPPTGVSIVELEHLLATIEA